MGNTTQTTSSTPTTTAAGAVSGVAASDGAQHLNAPSCVAWAIFGLLVAAAAENVFVYCDQPKTTTSFIERTRCFIRILLVWRLVMSRYACTAVTTLHALVLRARYCVHLVYFH